MDLIYRRQTWPEPWWRPLATGLAIIILVGVPLYFTGPWIFTTIRKQWHARQLEREGRRRADADWASHSPAQYVAVSVTYSGALCGGPDASTEVDPHSGFRVRQDMHEGWEPAYAARIDELLRRNGKPAWWYPQFPEVDELAQIWVTMRRGEPLPSTMTTETLSAFARDPNANIRISQAQVCIRKPNCRFDVPFVAMLTVIRDTRYPKLLFIYGDGPDDLLVVVDDRGRKLARVGPLIWDGRTGVRE